MANFDREEARRNISTAQWNLAEVLRQDSVPVSLVEELKPLMEELTDIDMALDEPDTYPS